MRSFALKKVSLPDDELLSAFVREYYDLGSFVPNEVLVPAVLEAAAGIEAVLTEQAGRRVSVVRPQRGQKAQLMRMAMDNAAHAYSEKARAREDLAANLATVMTKLGLPRPPERFECIDISHHGGQDTVAVVVAFAGGEPDRKRYRSFRVRTVSGGDDYGAIYEVLSRRFKRAQAGQRGWDLPDLLVVDGGKGQLAMAERALSELGVTDLPIAALAKEKANVRGEKVVDRLYLPGRLNAVDLASAGAPFRMFAYARDEAHRASNALRLKVGKQRRLRSALDDIRGVGPKIRSLLLKAFGDVSGVVGASVEAMVSEGATRRQAMAVHAHFHADEGATEAAEDGAVDNAFAEPPAGPAS